MLFYLEWSNGRKERSLMTLSNARKFAKEHKFTGFIISVDNRKDCEVWDNGVCTHSM